MSKAEEIFNHYYDKKFGGVGFLSKVKAKEESIWHVERIIENIQLLNHDKHFRTLFSEWQEVLKELKQI